jgi:uncharacterized caspase-like protein
MLRYLVVLISFIVFMSSSTYASRLALVIGNGDYQHEPSLANPVNDATDIAAALKKLGFQVILKRNAKRRAMIRAVQDFGKKLSRHDVGLFYYSGHGLQTRGENFLVPIDAQIKSTADIEFESVPANRILRQMEEANNGVNIVILDACRDNPFTTSQKGVRKGLAKMDSPTGSLIAFATAPNTSAWGGESGERNSVYTKYFLKALQNQAHLSITDLFIQIRKAVIQETQNETKQVRVGWVGVKRKPTIPLENGGFPLRSYPPYIYYILIQGKDALPCNAERCGSHSQIPFGNEENSPILGTGNPLTAILNAQLH